MSKFSFAVLVFIAAFFLNADDWSNKIINGQATGYKEFIGVVGIVYDVGDGYISLCSASLIDPEVLLTAGHCVYSIDDDGNVEINAVSSPSKISIHNGSTINYFKPIAHATKIIAHEDWGGYFESFGYYDDIALIKLDKRLTDLEIYGLRNNPLEEEGDVGTIVGYGITGDDKTDSGTHRKGTETIIDMNEVMRRSFTADSPSNTCSGDSGGPFFTVQSNNLVISGVTSFHPGNGGCTTENEFIHVLSYRDWIDEKMNELTGHGIDVICGNEIVETGETCDKNSKKCSLINSSYPANKDAPCNDSCSGYDSSECIVCGDGIKSGNEVCDGGSVDCSTLGNYESGPDAFCNSNCTGYDTYNCDEIICGDGVIQNGEVCDGGSKRCEDIGDLPEGRWAPCKENCKGYETDYCWYPETADCGNGVVEGEEECDDGNWRNDDGCSTDCKKVICGDGLTDINEECDHSDIYNTAFGYDCTIDCKINKKSGGCSLTVIY